MQQGKYLYDIVFSQLKQEILDGIYEFGALLPSEREISIRFGVERTTVRKALEKLVAESLVEKKAGVGTKVLYRKAAAAPPPPPNSGHVIGFFMEDDVGYSRKITQPYYADLFYHLEIECKAHNYQLIYATINAQTNINDLLRSHNFLSVVFVTRTDYAYVEQAMHMGIPTILVNEYYPGLTSICYDNIDGAYQVIRYLNGMGHKNIAIISGPENYCSSIEKLAGCYKALGELDLRIPPKNIAKGNWEYQSGYDCARTIFQNRPKDDIPTALFAFNDMMCIGAMRALRDMSLSIPGDVSVVGFDNMEQLKYTEPDLTTVDSHIAFMAHVIVEYATHPSLCTTELGKKILTPADLVIRKTVKDIHKNK